MTYTPHSIEEKWIRRWEAEGTHQQDVCNAARPYYNLMMFPYPSAEGLHVGNMFSYVGSDIHGRYMRANDHSVFQPIGFDAFGIHSENYAIKTGSHPATQTPESIKQFRRQLERIGAMFDWSHCVETASPDYYRWTQWVFIKLFNAGLIYRKESAVNWCDSCKTVLSNEMAAGGICERCDSDVQEKMMTQWFARTTAYAQRMLDDMENVDWSTQTMAKQRNWIGRTEDENGEVRYRLHDWCISRQRYWGTPIPIVYCASCGPVAVPTEELPVELPYIEAFEPDGSGRNPLARCPDFVHTTCPSCGANAERETDVCDNFLDSSWYFLRYPCTDMADGPFDTEVMPRWCPVSMYVGGEEHAVMHLMYARFITMALHDAGYIPFGEPFRRFVANGMITRNGAKMAKSKGNGVNPDDAIDAFGSDVFRTYLMFMGPFTQSADYREDDVVGVQRFIERAWNYVETTTFRDDPMDAETERMVQVKVKEVTKAIEDFRYNSAIARLMEFLPQLQRWEPNLKATRIFIQLLAPFAPCIAHEMWERIGQPGMVCDAPWPQWQEAVVVSQAVEVPVQINGKVRGSIKLDRDMSEVEARERALAVPTIATMIGDIPIQRVIYVPGRVINIVL